jgi:hypothetical protein
MTSAIKQGKNKKFLCKVGLHKWGKWLRHSILSSNVVDIERKCKKCGEIKRKTIPRDFEFGSED